MEWIRTSQQLPNDGERVLLYTPYEFFGNDHTCVGNREGICMCTANIDGRKTPVFTHWMPLPPVPERL
jgi:hypothetical protein